MLAKKLSIINAALLLIILASGVGGIHIWLNPKYPSEVNGSALKPSPRTVEKPVIVRRNTPIQTTQEVSAGNLFRKERKEYRPANGPLSMAELANLPEEMPAPEILLKGVLIADKSKMAILNGTYPVRDQNNKIQDKPLKRKGYRIGDSIAGYLIKDIDKNRITMANSRGATLTLNVSKRTPEQKIQKANNRLYHKDPKAKEMRRAKIEKQNQPEPKPAKKNTVRTPRNKPAKTRRPRRSTSRIRKRAASGSPLKPAPKVAISGNSVPAPRVRSHISGQ